MMKADAVYPQSMQIRFSLPSILTFLISFFLSHFLAFYFFIYLL